MVSLNCEQVSEWGKLYLEACPKDAQFLDWFIDNKDILKGLQKTIRIDLGQDFMQPFCQWCYENKGKLEGIEHPIPKTLLKYLIKSANPDLINTPIPKTIREVCNSLEIILKDPNKTFYFDHLGRYYPISFKCEYNKGYSSLPSVILSGYINIPNLSIIRIFEESFDVSDFYDEFNPYYISYKEFLNRNKIYSLDDINFDSEDFESAILETIKISPTNTIFSYTGLGLCQDAESWGRSDWANTFSRNQIIVITENVLGYNVDRAARIDPPTNVAMVPLIRVFDFTNKTYLLVDYRDLTPMKWNKKLIDKLILPPKIKNIISKVFQTPQEELMRDIIHTKAHNIVIMASGNPGIGKTLTAEIYSQYTERPLYILEVMEIGDSLENIEKNLSKIFARITKWNALLLFDEADIFFHQRDVNLHRSIIVGIFLRMLEQFQGLLFLTTNRPDVIDRAFFSRITLHLKYPDLDTEARTEIWKEFLKIASMKIIDPKNIHLLGELELNGREIRNKVRILKVLHDDRLVSVKQLLDSVSSM